jgi:hypothetical protein
MRHVNHATADGVDQLPLFVGCDLRVLVDLAHQLRRIAQRRIDLPTIRYLEG